MPKFWKETETQCCITNNFTFGSKKETKENTYSCKDEVIEH